MVYAMEAGTNLPAAAPQFSPTTEQIELIKRTVAVGATDDELKLFIHQCKRTGLDPLAKQIYCIFRWQNVQDPKTGAWGKIRKMTIQTAIDGFRLVADRHGSYAGQIGPQWCGTDGVWKDVWLDDKAYPSAARVGVLREDFRETLWATANWASYAQKDSKGNITLMWKNMAPNQLAKCAEALGLRRAFPQELGGLFTEDELPLTEVDEAAGPVARPDAMRPALGAPTEQPLPMAQPIDERNPPMEGEIIPPAQATAQAQKTQPAPAPAATPKPAAAPKPVATPKPATQPPALGWSIKDVQETERLAREAAKGGSAVFQKFYRELKGSQNVNALKVVQGLANEIRSTYQKADEEIAAEAERRKQAEAANESNEAAGYDPITGELFP